VTAPSNSVVSLGRIALAFGRVNRITYHPDGTTPESDTDHTVMLGLIACALAAGTDLDVGLVAQYALVHDLVEVYAGDTATLQALSADDKADKAQREWDAFCRIAEEFGGDLPWVPEIIAKYEARIGPEARFVKALDKLMPKVTHILNDLATIREQGVSPEALKSRYDLQVEELREYAADFPDLFELREDLVGRVMGMYRKTKETAR
jgi:putative hydrolase of HD superfamily